MKMMLRRLAIVVCVTLALLSAAYAFAVLRTHSGTGFWKVWLVLAVVFALLAIGIACHWWAALPRIIRGRHHRCGGHRHCRVLHNRGLHHRQYERSGRTGS